VYILLSILRIDGTYQRHEQICSCTYTVDRKWEFKIYKDSSFQYDIETIDTRDFVKSKPERIFGSWTLVADTLKLSPKLKIAPEISFLIKENRLSAINQKFDTIRGFINKLDYLEKSFP
jgi:hypothetical protein